MDVAIEPVPQKSSAKNVDYMYLFVTFIVYVFFLFVIY